jgi:1A family penicillin-binding protein
MAIKRTGTIFSARAFRLQKILEAIGKPIFWALLGLTYLFILVSSLTGRFILSFLKLIPVLGRLTRRLTQKAACLQPPKFKIILPKKILTTSLALVFLLLSLWYLVFKDLPHPEKLITREQILSTKIYDRHGELLYKIYRTQNRSLVPLKEIPLQIIQATIAIEDAEFYQHRGFSWKGIVRALFKNLRPGDKLYGGSTITQQLVKNALLTPERTWSRKIKEILLALWAETKFTKDEILQMYLNEVGYGGTAYGVEEAAQTYFGKSVREVNLAEATLLAGLPASPTSYSPFGTHPKKAKERQKLVLRRMREEKFITSEEEKQALADELHFAPQRTDIKAPHFVMYVKDWLVKKYGLRMVEEGGLEVKTSLDLNLQNQTQTIVHQAVDQLQGLRITNGAVLVTRPATGEILAMVGSRDYFDLEHDGNVNVTLSERQPGSAIKPVNYSVALEKGFTAATIIPDTPITYRLPGQPPYSPRNYDNRFHGNTPLRIALASSYNVPAVKVLSALGVDQMIKRGQKMGITTWEDRSRFGLSLTLGGGEVKIVDMAVVYGVLANLGERVDLSPILEIKNYRGKTQEKAKPKSQRIFDSSIAYLLTDILADNAARTPAFGANSVLNITNHPHVAVKTGTTQNLRDNWAIGYTPDFVVAVWVGNNDNTPMSYVASGITGASPIWQQIMAGLLKDVPDKEFPQPEGLVHLEICPQTGTLPCEGCGGKWEYFLPGSEPKTHCQPAQTPIPSPPI